MKGRYQNIYGINIREVIFVFIFCFVILGVLLSVSGGLTVTRIRDSVGVPLQVRRIFLKRLLSLSHTHTHTEAVGVQYRCKFVGYFSNGYFSHTQRHTRNFFVMLKKSVFFRIYLLFSNTSSSYNYLLSQACTKALHFFSVSCA